MKGYSLWDALKDRDFQYIYYGIWDDFYYDHIYWRIHHWLLNERCENCRNWHFCGLWEGRMYGTCDIHTWELWEDYHAHCPCWNLDPEEDPRYSREDGWEMRAVTPCGKVITQISRGGINQYLYDGEPKWWK